MSTAKFNQWLNSDGTENYKCRAWVNFNGTGTVAIRASGNVSSITDNGVGDYTVNFTTAMPDVNYAFNATRDLTVNDNSKYAQFAISSMLTSSLRLNLINSGISTYDSAYCQIAIFR